MTRVFNYQRCCAFAFALTCFVFSQSTRQANQPSVKVSTIATAITSEENGRSSLKVEDSIAYKKVWESVALDAAAVSALSTGSREVIFHFGTGNIHHVGLENMRLPILQRHFIYAVTGSFGEFETYAQMLKANPELALYYHVHYTDAFLLSHKLLPTFDVVNMFHVGEYSDGDFKKEQRLLLQIARSLKPMGKLFLHRGSNAFSTASEIMQQSLGTVLGDERFLLPLIQVQSHVVELVEYNLPSMMCSDVVEAASTHRDWARFYKSHCSSYKNCTELYDARHLRSYVGAKFSEATVLMVVGHPDDELIFGGNLVPETSSLDELVIVYCTNDLSRMEMVDQIVKVLGLAGAIILPHADTPISSLHVDYRLYRDLRLLINSRKWNAVITHGEFGEYGHVLHKILHVVVKHIIAMTDANLRPNEFLTFSSEPGVNINTTFLARRRELLESVYKRSAQSWAMIEIYGISSEKVPLANASVRELNVCIPSTLYFEELDTLAK